MVNVLLFFLALGLSSAVSAQGPVGRIQNRMYLENLRVTNPGAEIFAVPDQDNNDPLTKFRLIEVDLSLKFESIQFPDSFIVCPQPLQPCILGLPGQEGTLFSPDVLGDGGYAYISSEYAEYTMTVDKSNKGAVSLEKFTYQPSQSFTFIVV